MLMVHYNFGCYCYNCSVCFDCYSYLIVCHFGKSQMQIAEVDCRSYYYKFADYCYNNQIQDFEVGYESILYYYIY